MTTIESIPGSIVLYAQGGSLKSSPHRLLFEHPEMQRIYMGSKDSLVMYLVGYAPVPSPDGRWLVITDPLPSGPHIQPGTTWFGDLLTGELTKRSGPAVSAVPARFTPWLASSERMPGKKRAWLSHKGQQIAYLGQDGIYVFDRESRMDSLIATYDVVDPVEVRWSADDGLLIVGTQDTARSKGSAFWGTILALKPEAGSVPELLVGGDDVYLVDVIPDAASISAVGGDAGNAREERSPGQPERSLLIDQSEQVMYVYEEGIQARTLPVSTGMPTSTTLTRSWSGMVGRYLGPIGVNGGLYVDDAWHLYQDLYGNILIHSVPYARESGLKVYDQLDAVGTRPSSHGCIRVWPEDARWLREWDPVGVAIEITPWHGEIRQVIDVEKE